MPTGAVAPVLVDCWNYGSLSCFLSAPLTGRPWCQALPLTDKAARQQVAASLFSSCDGVFAFLLEAQSDAEQSLRIPGLAGMHLLIILNWFYVCFIDLRVLCVS